MDKPGVEVTSPEMWGLSPSMFHKDWKTFLVHFHNFAALPTTKGRSIESPIFTCNDQKWSLSLYPGGDDFDYSNDIALLFSEACCFAGDDVPGYVSMYLSHRSRGNATATFEMKIINKYGDAMETRRSSNNRLFDITSSNSGWSDIIKVSDILDESKNILDSNGTLTVAISIESTSASSPEAESAPKLDSIVSDELPGEPSWMIQGLVDASCQTESIDSDGQPDDLSNEVSLISNQDMLTNPGCSDCRDDDDISNKAGSLKEDVISVTSPEMCGLPPSMFHGEWKSFLIHFPNFAEHSTTKGRRLESPEFECNDQKWALRLYPGGNTSAADTRCVGLYLSHRTSGNATATFEIMIINKYGDAIETRRSSDNRLFNSSRSNSGWSDMIKVSDILDESKNILDKNSTLTVVVSMKNATIHVKKAQPTASQQNDLVLKKLIIKCLLKNEPLPENTVIGSRGGDKIRTLQRDPSMASQEKQQQLPKTRDPPESYCSTQRPKRDNDVETAQISRDALSQPPKPEEVRYPLYTPNSNLQPPAPVRSASVRPPISVRTSSVHPPTSIRTSSVHPPTSIRTPSVQNTFYASQKSFCSAPSPYRNSGERGLSRQAMERRRHYKEMILEQQLKLTQTQAQLAQTQRHIFVNKID